MKPYPVMGWWNVLREEPELIVTHSEDALGYPFAQVADWREYTHWKSAESGSLYVKVDASFLPEGVITVEALAIAGHNMATERVENLVLLASDNDEDYFPCFEPVSPSSDRLFFRRFVPQSRRYFKLVIPSCLHPPRLGELFLGPVMEIPAYPEPGFDPDALEAEVAVEISRTGRLLGLAPRFCRREIQARFNRLPPAFIAQTWLPFFQSHGTQPFYFCWDPAGRPEETYLVRLKEPKVEAPYERAFRSLTLHLISAPE